MSDPTLWWRHIALAGLAVGLVLAPALGVPGGWPVLAAAPSALAVSRPRPAAAGGRAGTPRRLLAPVGALWLALVLGAAVLIGSGLGSVRLAAIASGAADGHPGGAIATEGFITSQPRRSGPELRAVLDTSAGRFLLTSEGRPPDGLRLGSRVRARGLLAEPEPWRERELDRLGARLELRAGQLSLLPGGRGGVTGLLDRTRARAERGLTAGLDDRRAALARGFVLGQDELIDPATRERFVRSGLAHLLAVSGQNVMLLAILAGVLLSVAGVGPRARMALVIFAIAAYVPLAGGGPSIQRAGVMGAAGILAGLLGRPADRAYLPLLAAVVTLLLNPLAASDVGWQLSFAAVVGISLFAPRLAGRLRPVLSRLAGERLGVPLAEAAGLTLAATIATAPLMAHHFEAVSIASLPANLLAFAAVGPVMWLGMLAAGLGQFPFVPTGPLAVLQGVLIRYVDSVAGIFAEADWALVDLPLPRPLGVAAALLGLGVGLHLALTASDRRQGLRVPRRLRRLLGGAAITALALVAAVPVPGTTAPGPGALRITVLDVGQGDAILVEPPGGPAALIDTGPAGAGLGRELRSRGVKQLGDVVLTHDQRDHAGGLDELRGAVGVGRIVHGRADAAPAAAALLGADELDVAAGDRLRWGRAEATVLWPPAGSAGTGDPNATSLVLLLRYRRWRVLLTGDAEFEATRLTPGPVDLLKLPHHGSADRGLGPFLARSVPPLAVASLGAGNPHGHPAPGTEATLAARGICLLRTDLHGSVAVELGPDGMRVEPERSGLPGECG